MEGRMELEYVRSLSCNYERVKLKEKPQEKRYQYCMISRGGIKGLLPCDLRYINGEAFLYYDITSKQDLWHLYEGKHITREILRECLWSIKKLRQELERFLLDVQNVMWYPNQIFQDLETGVDGVHLTIESHLRLAENLKNKILDIYNKYEN